MRISFTLEAIMISTYVALSLEKHQGGSVLKIVEENQNNQLGIICFQLQDE
jgi:hypothetical protein